MSIGYTQRLIQENLAADESKLGVALGRICIKNELSVVVIASHFGVTRQTIYNWFMGTEMRPHMRQRVLSFINSYE